MTKQRHLLATLAASALLTLAACDDGAKPEPAKTAKADAQADAKADPKAEANADADPDADPDAEPDAPPEESKDDVDDTAEADSAPDAAPDEDAEGLDGYDPRVAKAAQVATKISEDPQKADDVLAAADLDRDKLDALMYEIANDPDLTTQYRMARGI